VVLRHLDVPDLEQGLHYKHSAANRICSSVATA
jgi:hypothetical protein